MSCFSALADPTDPYAFAPPETEDPNAGQIVVAGGGKGPQG
jgi:hypothetical protein